MSDYFVFNGVDSRTYNAFIFNETEHNAPARVYSKQAVPAKNGQLFVDEKRYGDVTVKLPFVIYQNFTESERDLRNFLLSTIGYKRLEDSRFPDEFYLAVYDSNYTVRVTKDRSMGKGVLSFTRKPQRFLKSGETATTLTASGGISNPTMFDSKPLLRIYGTGTVEIGDNAVTISEADTYTDIDCEIMEAYKGTVSRNAYVSIQNIDFPVLHPGSNGITLGTGITRVDITPRWFRL